MRKIAVRVLIPIDVPDEAKGSDKQIARAVMTMLMPSIARVVHETACECRGAGHKPRGRAKLRDTFRAVGRQR